MNKHLGTLVIAAGSLLFCLSASAASPGQNPSLTALPTTAENPRDCDKNNSARKSANQKPAAKTTQAETSSAAKAGDTRKDTDKVSDERMSTRGLKPPPKDKDNNKNAKPDAKSPSTPDSPNLK